MGLLYDLIQATVGYRGLEYLSFECWINWKRSAPLMPGKDNSGDDTNSERIWVDIDSTHSDDVWTEPPLEIEFETLASNKHIYVPFI